MTTNKASWVVVVTEGEGDDTVCQVVSIEYGTKQDADDFAANVAMNLSLESLVEVCTVEEAEMVVTD